MGLSIIGPLSIAAMSESALPELETPVKESKPAEAVAAQEAVEVPDAKRRRIEKSQPTNFERVREFHDAFGVKIADTPRLNVFDEDQKLVKLRIDLIDEEV